MSVRNQFKLLLGGLAAHRSGGAPPHSQSAMREFHDRSRLIAAVIFLVTVFAQCHLLNDTSPHPSRASGGSVI